MCFESYAVYHCAPTLAGIKPSNLFTWRHARNESVKEHVFALSGKLSGRGITVETLCECWEHSLVLVYRKNMLEESLNQPGVRDFLSKLGYQEKNGLRGYLDRLKSQISTCPDFPHEIGLFLGYPLHDVAAFIDSPDKRCSTCGEWKAYQNEEDASRVFESFRKCRAELYARFLNGSDISELVA